MVYVEYDFLRLAHTNCISTINLMICIFSSMFYIESNNNKNLPTKPDFKRHITQSQSFGGHYGSAFGKRGPEGQLGKMS